MSDCDEDRDEDYSDQFAEDAAERERIRYAEMDERDRMGYGIRGLPI